MTPYTTASRSQSPSASPSDLVDRAAAAPPTIGGDDARHQADYLFGHGSIGLADWLARNERFSDRHKTLHTGE